MKKKIYLVLMVIFLFFMVSCKNSNADNKKESEDIIMGENNINNANRLTLEYVCGEFNMDESEFDGVDFDAFVSYYGLTYDNIKEGDPRFLLNDYKSLEDKMIIPDYSSIKATTDIFLPEYIDKVELVIIEDIKGETCQTIIIDFRLGKVFSIFDSIDNITSNDIVKDTDDTVRKVVIESMNKHNISNWSVNKTDDDGDIVGTKSGRTVVMRMSNKVCYGISYKPGNQVGDVDGFVEDVEKLVSN